MHYVLFLRAYLFIYFHSYLHVHIFDGMTVTLLCFSPVFATILTFRPLHILEIQNYGAYSRSGEGKNVIVFWKFKNSPTL